MAHSNTPDSGSGNGVLDLKTVLGGAGALIVVLVGITWGLVNSNHADEVADNQRTNQLQWERIRALDGYVQELRGDVKTLRRDVDDQEVRIRAEEHKSDRR